MAIRIDFAPLTAVTGSQDYDLLSDNPGFCLYWEQLNVNPQRVAMYLSGKGPPDFAGSAALEKKRLAFQSNPSKADIHQSLGRTSGVSIEQLVLRHLPEGAFIETQIAFVPGADIPLCNRENLLVLNGLDLEMINKKVCFHGVHLLSLLTNRVHKLASSGMSPRGRTGLEDLLKDFFLEGAATLFFSLPGQTEAGSAWRQAEQSREQQIEILREILTGKESNPGALKSRLDYLALSGSAAIAARYPLATYICQVIEGAFGRSRLVEIIVAPDRILPVYEEARVKFSLPDRYRLV